MIEGGGGGVPDELKHADIKPIYKKNEEMKNKIVDL